VYYYIDFNATDDFTSPELLKWALDTNASWLNLDTITGELSGTPSKVDLGTFWVNLSVVDEEEERAYYYFIVNVSKSPNQVPKLFNFLMLPREGDTKTDFTFSVHYSDEDSEPPAMIQVVIDGVGFDMELQTAENAYNGKYKTITKLTEGSHTYHFMASDGIDTISSQTFLTFDVEKAGTEEPSDYSMLWVILLVFIIVIIVVIISLFLKLKRKKEQEPEEEIVPPIPTTKQPEKYPETLEQQLLIPAPSPSTGITEEAKSQITTPTPSQTVPSLPPTTLKADIEPLVEIPDDGEDEETLETSEPIPLTQPQEQELESIVNDMELPPDDSEPPEISESERSGPLFTEPIPATDEIETLDQDLETKLEDTSDISVEDNEKSANKDLMKTHDQEPQTEKDQSQPQVPAKKEED
jgi:hypothetical protein